MIDLGRPALTALGVTVFCDHADPARFHYLPQAPRLRVDDDGRPDLLLVKYRLDPGVEHALGAGLLSLTVDLAVDDATLAELGKRVHQRFALDRAPQLAPVAADTGTCELQILDHGTDGTGARLAPRVFGATSPSLFGDNAATFLVVLDAEGASLVEQTLRDGSLPAGVVYQLQAAGLRPALRAQITARWEEIYHYYENRLSGGKLLFAADIGKTATELRDHQAIEIHIDDLVPDADKDAVYGQALARVQDDIVERLFKPSLATDPPAPPSDDGLLETVGRAVKDVLGGVSLTYALKAVDRTELKTLSYSLAAARAELITLAPQGTLAVLRGARDVAGLIREVEPAAAPEMVFDVGALPDLAREEIEQIEIALRYGDRSQTITLDPAHPRASYHVWYTPELGPAVELRYLVHFAGAAERLESAPRTTRDRVIRIDPRELYRRVGVRVLAIGVPFDRFPTVLVDLRADAAAEDIHAETTLELDAGHADQRFTVRVKPDTAVMRRRRLRYIDGHGTETAFDWGAVDDDVMVVGDPFPDVLDVALLGSARFGTEVARLVVELRPLEQPDRVDVRVLTRDAPSQMWSYPLHDPRARGYEYRVTVHTVRGEVHEGKWLPGTGAKLVVGEGIAQLRTIQVMLLGKPLGSLGLLGVKVRLAFSDPEADLAAETEQLIVDTARPLSWTYPVAAPERIAYTCQLTLVHGDGTLEPRPPITSSDLLLLQAL